MDRGQKMQSINDEKGELEEALRFWTSPRFGDLARHAHLPVRLHGIRRPGTSSIERFGN
jgi:hypothetical protein